MKVCTKCKEAPAHTKSYCKPCAAAMQKTLYYKSPERKAAIKAVRDKVRNANKAFLRRYKSMCGCLHCKEKDWVVLELHHVDPSTKEQTLSALCTYSRVRLKAEIRKCIVLCANCHRREHHRLRLES